MLQSGDTAFVLISAALVLLMIPGLALFYGGMVRKKNVLGTIMQSFILISLVTFEWIYLGYSMSFGPDLGGLIGSLAWAGLGGVGAAPNADYAPTVPHIAFAMYQCMFAAITPALITGAVAERMRFGPFLVFSLAWTICIYNPVCHWVWGSGGWLKAMGVLDFAGGIVVHLTCGVGALAAVMLTGPRKDHGKHQIVPHNLPMTLLGTGLLWFGWFGFNAGSALAADGVAAGAFAATHIGGMAGMAMWSGVEWWHRGKPTTLGAASGAVAGLATITPGAGFVSPASAVVIGLLAGLICYGAVLLKARLRFDDSLDVVGIHGVGGVLGTILVGVFASKLVNPAGADGLLAGNPSQLGVQLLAIAVVGVFAFAGSWLIMAAVKAAMGLRLTPQAETIGLDLSEHTEAAYGE